MASGSSKWYTCNYLNCRGQEAVSYSTVCRHERVYRKVEESASSLGYKPEENIMDGDACMDHVDPGQS